MLYITEKYRNVNNTMRYHFYLSIGAEKNVQRPVLQRMWLRGTLIFCLWKNKTWHSLGDGIWQYLSVPKCTAPVTQ